MTLSHDELFAAQDDVLLALSEAKRVPMDRLRQLPPWRAVMLARIAVYMGLMTEGEREGLISEALKVGGAGELPQEPA